MADFNKTLVYIDSLIEIRENKMKIRGSDWGSQHLSRSLCLIK